MVSQSVVHVPLGGTLRGSRGYTTSLCSQPAYDMWNLNVSVKKFFFNSLSVLKTKF